MKTIVVGLDASERAQLVLEAGRLMADRLGAKVTLVSATEEIEWQGALPPELVGWDSQIRTQSEKSARDRLAVASERFPIGTVIEQRVGNGPAWQLICQVAKEQGASLIVVGTHTHRAWERMLGTTAAKVANRAETSVLVVRGTGAKEPVAFDRVLVAHDGSDRAAGVLASALTFVRGTSGRLFVVRAINQAQQVTSEIWGKRPNEIEALLVAHARDALNALVPALGAGVEFKCEARIGAPWEVVLEEAKSRDASLIVIGSHGFDAIDRVLGTVAGRVVNHADRSVLIVRGDGLR